MLLRRVNPNTPSRAHFRTSPTQPTSSPCLLLSLHLPTILNGQASYPVLAIRHLGALRRGGWSGDDRPCYFRSGQHRWMPFLDEDAGAGGTGRGASRCPAAFEVPRTVDTSSRLRLTPRISTYKMAQQVAVNSSQDVPLVPERCSDKMVNTVGATLPP